MKYTTPYAELVALEAVSVLLTSTNCDDYCPEGDEIECEDEGEGF